MHIPSFLIHSQVDVHLSGFQYFGFIFILNKVAMHFTYTSLCTHIFPFLLDKYLGADDSLILEDAIILLSNVALSFFLFPPLY